MSASPKLYSKFAKYYDRLENQYRDYALEEKWLGGMLDDHSSKRVIDISCGTGNHVSGLVRQSAQQGLKRELVAMDASEEMVRITSAKIRAVGGSPELLRGDFLNMPFVKGSFDCAICMYWSLAGLNHEQVRQLFYQVHLILGPSGLFIFDVENSEGIKENLLNEPFIDAFFDDENGNSITRANLSRKIQPDLVDWHAYYLIERGGVTELFNDNMKLRFYSRADLSKLLSETGFALLGIYSAPFVEYRDHSPSLYFVSENCG
ncbi:MAG: class I SAM-dependent DNA methyltransferase [Nitrososphaerales archaeon]